MFLIPEPWYAIRTLKKKGRGVIAKRDIAAGTVIGDYLGTIMRRDGSDEKKNGLYDMAGGLHYEILASPKKKGVQLINHACANNCEMFPYQGHMLYFAARKIFRGEELTVNYGLYAPDEDMPCNLHACYCGSKFCTGSMHDDWKSFDTWEALLKKQFGPWYRKVPGRYGTELPPLKKYPKLITKDHPKLFAIFGSETKPAKKYGDATLPPIAELRKRIRETGLSIALPKPKIIISGIKGNIFFAERIP